MPRITFLTTGLAVGGAEAQVVLLATRLSRRGWNVAMVSMLPPRAYVETLEREGVPVFDLGMRRGIPDPRALFRLAALLRKLEPDILHCHQVHANYLGRMTRLFTEIPALISTAHNWSEGGFWRGVAYRLTDPLADLTTNVCRAGTERYIRLGLAARQKTIWVPNGIDLSDWATPARPDAALRSELTPDGGFLWLAVGNLRDQKDYPNLLRAIHLLRAHQVPFRVAIAGTGPMRTELEQLAAELGIGRHVLFLGQRRDVPALLVASDAMVMSSAWEGLSIALLEAAAAKRPAVATTVGGNPEIIDNGRTGFLVPPRDHHALAETMLRMMRLPAAERAALGEAARDRVEEHFSIESVIRTWESIYTGFLAGPATCLPSSLDTPRRLEVP